MKGTVIWLSMLVLVAGTALAGGTSAALVSGYGYLPKGTEIVELRDEFSKHYSNGDGTITAEIHGTPIHRLDENGRWVETDATQNFASNGDSYVDSQNAGTNYGNATTLYVYRGVGRSNAGKAGTGQVQLRAHITAFGQCHQLGNGLYLCQME